MTDTQVGFHGVLVNELIQILKNIFDTRNQRRAYIFSKELAPLMDNMRINHNDFVVVTSGLISIISTAIDTIDNSVNDIDPTLNHLFTRLRALNETREKRRVERRELFEDAYYRATAVTADVRFTGIVLTESEASNIKLFYEAVSKYFVANDGEYRHELPGFLSSVGRSLRLIQRNTELIRKQRDRLNILRKRIAEYEMQLETNWASITSNFAPIKLDLTPR